MYCHVTYVWTVRCIHMPEDCRRSVMAQASGAKQTTGSVISRGLLGVLGILTSFTRA